jgi:hypothetical protein
MAYNTRMKILGMFFLSHDLYSIAVDSNGHHKTVTYFL